MFQDNLKLLRKLNGFSQEAVAEELGVSRQAYAKWENGESVPDILKCQQISKLYKVSLDGLLQTQSFDEYGCKIPPAPIGKHLYGSVIVNEHGQIVIPKEAREQFGIREGDRVIVLGDEAEGLALIPSAIFEERMRRLLASVKEELSE